MHALKAAVLISLATSALKASATISPECDDLKSWQMRLALAASNLLNAKTTRTPEGGAFKPFETVTCKNGECEVQRSAKQISKYEPNHPDADKKGYVNYPSIDTKAERMTITIAAKQLRGLGDKHVCKSELRKNGNSASVHYDAVNLEPLMDSFTFDDSDHLKSWSRIDLNGQMSAIEFAKDGSITVSR